MESYATYQNATYPHHTQPQQNHSSPVLQSQGQPNYAHQQQQMANQPMMMQPGYHNPGYAVQSPYGLTTHAAAAMATASGYPNYSMAPDASLQGSLPQSSPRLQQVKTDGSGMHRPNPQSPRQQAQLNIPGTMGQPMGIPAAMASSIPPQMANQQMQQAQRRMSHSVASPAVPSQQQTQVSMAAPQRPPTATQAPPPPQQPQQPSPEIPVAGSAEESPLYVNAKQFHRILKRRMARQKLEEQLRISNKGRKPYLHESRHNHAMRRPRGPGGRFLTAEEVANLEAGGTLNGDAGPSTNGSTKRRASATENGDAKRSKSSGEDDEDDDA